MAIGAASSSLSISTIIISREESFFKSCLYFHYMSSIVTFVSLQFIQAPYGKHSRSGWGPRVGPVVSWALMESPSLVLPLAIFPLGINRSNPISMVIMSLFVFHYFHRTCIYPVYLKNNNNNNKSNISSSPTPLPLSIPILAFTFNCLNAYLQTRWVSHYAPLGGSPPTLDFWVRFSLGSLVFFLGFGLNVWSDRVLVGIKRQGKGGGYRVPRGGMFELVCSPNYLGEMMEWLGWAIITWSSVGLAFFLSTCANLVPRARAHRRWYLDKFPHQFPHSRKAIFPFLY